MSLISYRSCRLCPRQCGVNRSAGQRGFCGETSELRLGFAGIHRGEEPPITGEGGSGTIFVSGCNLRCAFCQNHQISQGGLARAVSPEEFAEICLALEKQGAENINIVTGSHAAPALLAGIETARKQGLGLPVLWNSSGFEGEETLEIISGFVDVYLPDLKTLDSEISSRFFRAPLYGEHAKHTIEKMIAHRELSVTPLIHSGVIIRHLVIPGLLENTRTVLAWFARHCRGRALLSLMTQYTEVHAWPGSQGIPGRYVSKGEYEALLAMLEDFGIDDGFCQELIPGSDWLPDFRQPNPFPSKLSLPIWHWKYGFLPL